MRKRSSLGHKRTALSGRVKREALDDRVQDVLDASIIDRIVGPDEVLIDGLKPSYVLQREETFCEGGSLMWMVIVRTSCV